MRQKAKTTEPINVTLLTLPYLTLINNNKVKDLKPQGGVCVKSTEAPQRAAARAPQADSSRVPVSHHAHFASGAERAAPQPGGTVSAGGRRAARGPERAVRDCRRPSPCQGVADVVRGVPG